MYACNPEETAILEVLDFSLLPNEELHEKKSVVLKTRKMKWTFYIRWVVNDPVWKSYMIVEGECENENESWNNWSCDALLELDVTSFCGKSFSGGLTCHFTKESQKFNFGKVWSMETFPYHCAPGEHLELTMVAYVQIRSLTGVEEALEFSDFSIPKNIDAEVVLYLKQHKFHVDKYVLMCFSSVFREILSSGSKLVEINSEGFHFNYNIVSFLRLLYGQKQEIAGHNLRGVLALANTYDVRWLMAYVEDFLITTDEFTVHEKLDFAKMYNLSRLQSEMREYLRKLRNRSAF